MNLSFARIYKSLYFAMLSKEKLEIYLERFANPKFRTFVRNTVYGKT